MSNPTFAQGELIQQITPDNTSPQTFYAAATGAIPIEITLITAVTLTGSPIVSLFQDNDGTTFDNTNIIMTAAKTANDNPLLFHSPGVGSGIFLKPGGAIGVQVSLANSVTFSMYAIAAQIAEYIRGREGAKSYGRT